MRNAFYLLIDIPAFFLYALIHTLLASFKVKNYFALRLGNMMAFYRLVYNLLSLFLLFYLFEFLPRPDFEIYDLPYPFDLLILIPQFLALAGIIWTFRYFSLYEFLGISQIIRLTNGTYLLHGEHGNSNIDSSENLTLKIEGPYKVVRHPLYLFTLLFLLFRPTMDLFYFVSLICIIAYFYIGSFYEERKLAAVFGEEYKKYQETVPRLFGWQVFRFIH